MESIFEIIIKILAGGTSFLVFLKIIKKISICEFLKNKLKLSTQLRVFIFFSLLYALLMIIPTFMEVYLNIYNGFIKIIEGIIAGVVASLWISISSNIPINDKSWLG